MLHVARTILMYVLPVGAAAALATTATVVYDRHHGPAAPYPAEYPPPQTVVEQPVVMPQAEVIVETPPPDQIEVITVAPAPEFVWVGGWWVFGGGRYSWHSGHWERPPYPRAAWQPGHWDRARDGHVWVRGRWR